jgi:hypothetical protein
MESKAAICNMALGRIQVGKRIANFDTDKSSEAQACRDVYDHCRDEVLERFRWKFAERQALLSALGGAAWSSSSTYAAEDTVTYAGVVYFSLQAANLNHQPDTSGTFWRKVSRDPWSYVYELPDDCVSPREIFYSSAYPRDFETPPYDLVSDASLGTLLVTNLTNADLRYTARVDNPKAYPPGFSNSLANRLSAELAGSVKGDPLLADARLKVYERQAPADFGAECNTTEPGQAPDSIFITSRC